MDYETRIKLEFSVAKGSVVELSEDEKFFINELLSKLKASGIETEPFIKINRLGNKMLNLQYENAQIGRVKLQDRKIEMQVLKPIANTISDIEVIWYAGDSMEDCLQHLDEWVSYVRYIMSSEERLDAAYEKWLSTLT